MDSASPYRYGIPLALASGAAFANRERRSRPYLNPGGARHIGLVCRERSSSATDGQGNRGQRNYLRNACYSYACLRRREDVRTAVELSSALPRVIRAIVFLVCR